MPNDEMIATDGLTPAQVLAALYDASRPQGAGFVHYTPEPMTEAQAEALLTQYDAEGDPAMAGFQVLGVEKRKPYFDYLRGRVMKVTIDRDGGPLDPRLYDRDNGQGAAARALDAARTPAATEDTANA